MVDAFVIIVSFVLTLSFMVCDLNDLAKLTVMGRLIRAFVLVRFIRVVTEQKNLQTGIRHTVGQNKRRLRHGEFDLDMTYICK